MLSRGRCGPDAGKAPRRHVNGLEACELEGVAAAANEHPGRVAQIEHGEVSTVEALASYIAALGGKLELITDIGGHLLKMPAGPAA
jgi:hypothetical protein